jgi:hypothetical protein
LEKEREIAFHHTKVQLLFMAARACRNIQTTVSFLMTRVKAPDKDDWGKLKRVLRYLNASEADYKHEQSWNPEVVRKWISKCALGL